MSRVLNLLLTHQPPLAVARMLAWWRKSCPLEDVLIVFNGSEEAFADIEHLQKVRVQDIRLTTVRHSHERQSYTAVWRETSRWLGGRDFTHVYFAEYDHLPLVPDLNARQLARLERERADVLAHQLVRCDGTNAPHLLYHQHLPDWAEHWTSVSVRKDKTVLLSMLGTGSFWTRTAFDAVAARAEPFPIYLEIYLPTLAHHLGYRLRDWEEQNRHVSSLGDLVDRIEEARRDGAWTLHPVKSLWKA